MWQWLPKGEWGLFKVSRNKLRWRLHIAAAYEFWRSSTCVSCIGTFEAYICGAFPCNTSCISRLLTSGPLPFYSASPPSFSLSHTPPPQVISRHASANDHRSCKTLLQTSFKQSALFVIAGFSSLQMVASISIAASGNMPPLMSGVNDFFKVFLFRLPLVHPACVLDFVTPFALETCVLVAGLSLALFDFSQLTRWLRLEQIVFGWHCCKKYKSLIKVRDFIRSYVTPYMRYGSSQVLVLLYIVVVKIAIEMMSCSPSKALDGKKGLTNDPSIECFTPAHSPVFTLSVVVFILVGMLWPVRFLALTGGHLSLSHSLPPSFSSRTHHTHTHIRIHIYNAVHRPRLSGRSSSSASSQLRHGVAIQNRLSA